MLQKQAAIQTINREKTDKITITSAGFSGLLTALLVHLEYRLRGEHIRITVIGDEAPTDSPASHLAASISHNEILAVTPSPAEAKDSIEKEFTVPGGLAASLDILNTPKTKAFIAELKELSAHTQKLKDDQLVLEKYGEYCMLLWDRLLKIAEELNDQELLHILKSNSSIILPAGPGVRDDGKNHRQDIYINTPSAESKSRALVEHLQDTGYPDARLLSPEEYLKRVPYANSFVEQSTKIDESGKRVWRNDVSVVRRPAGRINAKQFMKHIARYLEQASGQYVSEDNEVKLYFRIKIRKTNKLVRAPNKTTVVDLEVEDPKTGQRIETKRKDSTYRGCFYVFNPGSRVRATDELGIKAPNNALFSGTYIQLKIPREALPEEQTIHTNLALRMGNGVGGIHTSVAQFYPDPEDPQTFIMHIAGTKTFCGDTEPERKGALEKFAKHHLVIQLKMLYMTFPELLTPVLGNKFNGLITEELLDELVKQGVAKIGVESRNVSTTNVTYAGPLIFEEDGQIASNAGLCHAPSSAGIAYGIGNAKGTLSAAGMQLTMFDSVYEKRKSDADAAQKLMTKLRPF